MVRRSTISRSARRWARAGVLSGVAFSVLAVGGVALVSRAQQPPLILPKTAPLPQKRGLGDHAIPAPAPVAPGVAPAPVVKITVTTNPPAKRVFVLWGKKRLGMIMPKQPLIIQRPRDSGPLDLTVQCDGYVSVQTRAFTVAALRNEALEHDHEALHVGGQERRVERLLRKQRADELLVLARQRVGLLIREAREAPPQ